MGAICSCCFLHEPPLGSPTALLAAQSPVPTAAESPPILPPPGQPGDSSTTPTPTPTSTRRTNAAGPLLLRLSLPWSTRSRASNPRTPSTPTGPPPCIRISHLSWTAQANLTDPRNLADHRDAFWDTVATYGGRSEIWMALRMAVDAVRDGDMELAKVIADAAQLTLPTSGDITCDPAYDTLGNAYTVPVYCLVDPSNLGHTPIAPSSAAAPISIDSSQETVATSSPTAPLLDAARAITTLDPASASSDESLAFGQQVPATDAQKNSPPPPFPTDRDANAAPCSSSSIIIKSTKTDPHAHSLDLIVRLSSGPSVTLPTARHDWSVSDAISAVMTSLDQSELRPFTPRAMMYLGRLLPPSLKLGDVQWVTSEGPCVLQLLVVPTGTGVDKREVVEGQEDEAGAKTPVAGRRKA
ncbi:hypothetical protein BCR44DRAFT_34218 [Catenaria anguillulae PL171]|uniref:DC-UbP/UBTD2 N-terminal domain-containing protein n=1 Tax=Catenaria anguillulae PL171 TaxID=765915 RepID=A0A1Y2HMW4_9FUNG|nr:hypothetical protein BCR44DRAFT_34218 [Catenaria anguillulae PL171]